jgi:hypothetical protein
MKYILLINIFITGVFSICNTMYEKTYTDWVYNNRCESGNNKSLMICKGVNYNTNCILYIENENGEVASTQKVCNSRDIFGMNNKNGESGDCCRSNDDCKRFCDTNICV